MFLSWRLKSLFNGSVSVQPITAYCLVHRQIPQRQAASAAVFALKPVFGAFAAFGFRPPAHGRPFPALCAVCQRLAGREGPALWNNSFVVRLIFFSWPSYMRKSPCFPSSAMFYPPHLWPPNFHFSISKNGLKKRFDGVLSPLFLLFFKLFIISDFRFFQFFISLI